MPFPTPEMTPLALLPAEVGISQLLWKFCMGWSTMPAIAPERTINRMLMSCTHSWIFCGHTGGSSLRRGQNRKSHKWHTDGSVCDLSRICAHWLCGSPQMLWSTADVTDWQSAGTRSDESSCLVQRWPDLCVFQTDFSFTALWVFIETLLWCLHCAVSLLWACVWGTAD